MISVVIPLYNKEKYIVNTLQCVINQTYSDYEVIIVNDGSTDHSQQVVGDYIQSAIINSDSNKSPIINYKSQIRLVSQPNGGVSSARNRGIQEAKGEYIAFLDADDLWEPQYLQTVSDLVQRYPSAVLYVIGSGAIYRGKKYGNEQNQPEGLYEQVWLDNPCFSPSACVVKREALLQIGGFDERMAFGEDLDVWWRLLLIGSVAYDKRILSWYLTDAEDSAMTKPKPLEKHIPYYIDKYAEARQNNVHFRHFFDREMVYRLYPYLFDPKYHKEAKRLSRKLDYSQLKWTMHFRMVCPHLYRLYERLKNIL